MNELLHNRWQARKVRWVLWAGWALAAACLAWGWVVLQSSGMNPGDGGELREFPHRLAAALGVSAMGVLPAAALTVFARQYVVGLVVEGPRLGITTLSASGRQHRQVWVPLRDVESGGYAHGRLDTGRSRVHAPWITLQVRGRRLPFLLDLQSERIDRVALAQLLPWAVARWKEDDGAPPPLEAGSG
jgi:hypothetical protein